MVTAHDEQLLCPGQRYRAILSLSWYARWEGAEKVQDLGIQLEFVNLEVSKHGERTHFRLLTSHRDDQALDLAH